jgi:acyl-coenzyme A thioesterase PaaI-like protein
MRFLRPVRPGRIVANGKVVRRDGDIAYLNASLTDAGGATIATATATAWAFRSRTAKPESDFS